MRLLDFFNGLNLRKLPRRPRFMTLTYPGEYERNRRAVQRQLDAFLHALERKYGQFPLVWRLEPQERGAPHFHILAFTKQYIDYNWVAKTWNRIVAPGDAIAESAGTQVRAVERGRQTQYYVSKYIAKQADGKGELDGTGRLWGIRHRKLFPIAIPVYTVQFETFLRLRGAINQRRAVLGLSDKILSKFQGTRLYQSEQESRKLMKLIPPDEEFPDPARWAGLFPEGVEPTDEWKQHMLPWWEAKQRPGLDMTDILAKIRLDE